jgi:hypothetical protein
MRVVHVVKELIMCYRIHADSAKDERKQAVLSDTADTAAERARHEKPDPVPGEPVAGSGVIAMFRRLFASLDQKAVRSGPHREAGESVMEERREVEKVD